MAPKHKSSDAGHSDTPREAVKCSLYKWKDESSRLRKERKKKSYTEVAQIYGKKEFLTCDIMKKEKESCAGFAIAPKTANAQP